MRAMIYNTIEELEAAFPDMRKDDDAGTWQYPDEFEG